MAEGLLVWNATRATFNSTNANLTRLQEVYLSALYQWYAYDNIYVGEQAFLNAMTSLTREFPTDIDALSIFGLAYLNVAGQSTSLPREIEPINLLIGRAILKYAFDREPDHPGILHYLIHAYDVPSIGPAVQGLPYANRYSEIVLTASHAQHMPAHIYARIGTCIFPVGRLILNIDATV